MRAPYLFGLFCSASVIAACSAAPSSDAADQSEQASSKSAPLSFVTVSADARGGFDVTSVNTGAVSRAARIDYSKTSLDADTIGALEGLSSTELVLEGQLASSGFVVATAYRGMPGVAFDSTATFYEAAGATAHALNESATRGFASVDASAVAAPFVQESWLANEVQNKGAIAAGHVSQGTKVLSAQQVFIALPYAGGPCLVSSHVCPDATPDATYTRDASLCLDFAACAAPGVCPFHVPVCATGYTLVSWKNGPQACPQYACDPSFLRGS